MPRVEIKPICTFSFVLNLISSVRCYVKLLHWKKNGARFTVNLSILIDSLSRRLIARKIYTYSDSVRCMQKNIISMAHLLCLSNIIQPGVIFHPYISHMVVFSRLHMESSANDFPWYLSFENGKYIHHLAIHFVSELYDGTTSTNCVRKSMTLSNFWHSSHEIGHHGQSIHKFAWSWKLF